MYQPSGLGFSLKLPKVVRNEITSIENQVKAAVSDATQEAKSRAAAALAAAKGDSPTAAPAAPAAPGVGMLIPILLIGGGALLLLRKH